MINQVTLVGRLTKDPDLRLTPEGTPVVNVILAVNRQFKNHQGEYDTDFVHCTLWRKIAENTATYCRKGSILGITGKIQTRNYSNQEGKKVYVTEVLAESVQFIGPKATIEGKSPPPIQRDTGNSIPRVPENVPAAKEWQGTSIQDVWIGTSPQKEETSAVKAGIS